MCINKKTKNLSYGLFDQTEKFNQRLPLDAHYIIKQRYNLAEKLATGKRVLEVGVGQGIAFDKLKKLSNYYLAVEYSSENINVLKTVRGINNNLLQVDAHKLPLTSDSFDLVLALAMVYYLNFEEFLVEASRVLKKNGILFFCTSNKDVPGFVPAPYTVRYYSVPELNELLLRHNFQCKFFGSFEAGHGSMLLLKLKPIVRNIIKFFFNMTPKGRMLWAKIRNRALGGLETLPHDIEQVADSNTFVKELDPNCCDSIHRIIYCEATFIGS